MNAVRLPRQAGATNRATRTILRKALEMSNTDPYREQCAQLVKAAKQLFSHGELEPGHRLLLASDVEALEEAVRQAEALLNNTKTTPLWKEVLQASAIVPDVYMNQDAIRCANIIYAVAAWLIVAMRDCDVDQDARNVIYQLLRAEARSAEAGE